MYGSGTLYPNVQVEENVVTASFVFVLDFFLHKMNNVHRPTVNQYYKVAALTTYLVVDRYEWKVESCHLAQFPGPQSGRVDDPVGSHGACVGRLDHPRPVVLLPRVDHRRRQSDIGSVASSTGRQCLRQRVRIDVPVARMVESGQDAVRVE